MLCTKAHGHVCILESDPIILNKILFFLRGERRVLHLSTPPPHAHSVTHIAVIAIIAVEAQPWLDNVVLKYHSNLKLKKNPSHIQTDIVTKCSISLSFSQHRRIDLEFWM